tara:strand:+ start:4490 stop:5281 length:792 start_codon:yes stop_codon:yes gene_type:complete
MLALVDADSLIYKVGFAIEDKTYWNEAEVMAGIEQEKDITYDTNIAVCYTTLDQLVSNIVFATGCDSAVLVFSGGVNFRYDFPISYKANRKASRRPEGYDEILAYARAKFNTFTTDGIEADDYVVYLKTKYPEDYLLCAIDKDVLYQTAGTHYNYNKDEEVTVSEGDATRYAYFQTLTGDTTDGYRGCYGVGTAKATKILAECETDYEMWQAVLEAYESKDQTEDEALWTMRLAQMHQFNGKSIELWNPPVAPVDATLNETTI